MVIKSNGCYWLFMQSEVLDHPFFYFSGDILHCPIYFTLLRSKCNNKVGCFELVLVIDPLELPSGLILSL